MKKTLLLIILIFTTIIFYSCNKNLDKDSPVSLFNVDIDSLNNKKMLALIYDQSLKEGVYEIITDNNKYIFFKGIKHEYVGISSKIEDETLLINCNIISSSEDSNKLYVIREKNTTSSKDKSVLFNKIVLKINDKDIPFNSISL